MLRHLVDPFLQRQHRFVVNKELIDQCRRMKGCINWKDCMDKDATKFGKIGMGDVGLKLTREAFVFGLGEVITSGLHGLQNTMECIPMLFILNVVAVLRQQGWLESADAGSDKKLFCIKMEVETAAAHPMTRSLPKDDPDPLFDRASGVTTGIPIDAKKGVVDLGGGVDRWDEDWEVLTHGFDERLGGVEDGLDIAFFIGLKPLFVVVNDDLREETDRFGRETSKRHGRKDRLYVNSADPTRTMLDPQAMANS